MCGPCHRQPPQQAGQAPRVRAPGSRPPVGLSHAGGMPPSPPLAPPPRHARAQQTQSRCAAAGAQARRMRLTRRRRKAQTTARRRAHPPPRARRQAPWSLPPGRARGTASLSPRVVTAHRQVKGAGAFVRPLHGLGGPVTWWRCRACRGAGGPPRWGGRLPALARGPEAGHRTGAQVWEAPHPVEAALAPQELAPHAPRAHPGQEGPQPRGQGLLGPPTAPGPGRAAAPDHGVGGGRGAHGGRAPVAVRRPPSSCGASATVPWAGQAPTATATRRPRVPKPWGIRGAQSAWPWPARASRALRGAARRPRTGGPAGARARCAPACWTDSLEAAAQSKPRSRSRLAMAPGMVRGHGASVLRVQGDTS